MKTINEKLNMMRDSLRDRPVRIMIIGLGSVGNYLLEYLMSTADERMEICVVGRSKEKLVSDVNIARVSSMIRGQCRSSVKVTDGVDLTDVSAIAGAVKDFGPDIIVNSSRAYPGLKYGSISWANIRAYGIWTPLAVRFTKNIMEACEEARSDAVVINTSYSDAVIPWLKTAGMAYPDFGSGNINHLLPRIRFAVADECKVSDYWNIDITFAVAHFHDVVISKEGQTEGVDMLIDIRYQGRKLEPDMTRVLSKCSIPMPSDAKRNQMNASSNYEIIEAILAAVRDGERRKLHCPGVFGEIGGYPVILDGTGDEVRAFIYEDLFPLEEMQKKNRESIYLDGVKDVCDGVLYYTPELLDKVNRVFGAKLPAEVRLDDAGDTADHIIREIIEPALSRRS